jgi:hypothetical protein
VLNQTIDLDRTFQALADKSRRSMVERLTLGPASVSELAEPLAMSLAAVLRRRGWETRLDRLGDILNEVVTTEEKP